MKVVYRRTTVVWTTIRRVVSYTVAPGPRPGLTKSSITRVCTVATCKGSCGQKSKFNCWCDRGCKDAGDCCTDYDNVCGECDYDNVCGECDYDNVCLALYVYVTPYMVFKFCSVEWYINLYQHLTHIFKTNNNSHI